MGRSFTANFEIIPRKRRAEDLVPTIRACSQRFKAQVLSGDSDGMQTTSREAWDAMTNLFEILRNEEDHGNLAGAHMAIDTAFVADDVTLGEAANMINAQGVDQSHSSYKKLSLRNTLNKIAHYDARMATFRLDGRGAPWWKARQQILDCGSSGLAALQKRSARRECHYLTIVSIRYGIHYG